MRQLLAALCAAMVMTAAVSTEQEAEIVKNFRAERDSRLRNPAGWLTLCGLFWLNPGRVETIGSASDNDFQLPADAPAHLGKLQTENGRVLFTNVAGSGIRVDGKPVANTAILKPEDPEHSMVQAGSVSFYVIQRSNKLAVRARDANSPALKQFRGTDFFPPNPAFHFQARFIDHPTKIPIVNIIGQTDEEDSPGEVEFTFEGKAYRLLALTEDNSLFFVFKDPTSKTETYQAGRMLNVPMPVKGVVDLDFNLAYSPPCTFTPYATCPLPPKQNFLPFAVRAGEKRYGHGHPG